LTGQALSRSVSPDRRGRQNEKFNPINALVSLFDVSSEPITTPATVGSGPLRDSRGTM